MKRVGAIPLKKVGTKINLLLVTSSTRGRWILPKGNLERGENHKDACLREAYEESGAWGRVLEHLPIETKITSQAKGPIKSMRVVYYPLLLEELRATWPEEKKRRRRFVDLEEAEEFLDKKEFKEVINHIRQHREVLLDLLSET